MHPLNVSSQNDVMEKKNFQSQEKICILSTKINIYVYVQFQFDKLKGCFFAFYSSYADAYYVLHNYGGTRYNRIDK